MTVLLVTKLPVDGETGSLSRRIKAEYLAPSEFDHA